MAQIPAYTGTITKCGVIRAFFSPLSLKEKPSPIPWKPLGQGSCLGIWGQRKDWFFLIKQTISCRDQTDSLRLKKEKKKEKYFIKSLFLFLKNQYIHIKCNINSLFLYCRAFYSSRSNVLFFHGCFKDFSFQFWFSKDRKTIEKKSTKPKVDCLKISTKLASL